MAEAQMQQKMKTGQEAAGRDAALAHSSFCPHVPHLLLGLGSQFWRLVVGE